MAEQTLKEKTSKGLFWGGMSNGVQQLLSVVFGIFLARTLSPEDYGLVGMLTIFSLIPLYLQEGGFVSALINRKKIEHEDYNSVFWFVLMVSFSCYLVLFLCAPLIARFFHHPELISISRWQFLGFVIAGFGTAPRALLQKTMRIKEIAVTNILAIVLSGSIGVFLALKGMAYWSLVFQSLVLGAINTGGYCFFSKWKPSFEFAFQPIKEMFGFGILISISNILYVINTNIITIFMGRLYPSNRVGYYTQANKWYGMGNSTLNGMITGVVQTVMAEVIDDPHRLLNVFRKVMRFCAFVSFPAMFGLGFIAPEFIVGLLKDKWMDSVPLLQILCVGGSVSAMVAACNTLFLAKGKSSYLLWVTFGFTLINLLVVCLIYPYGVTAMVIGFSAVNVLSLLVWTALARREIGYRFMDLLADILPFMGLTLLCLVLTWLVTRNIHNLYCLLFAKIIITGLLYVVILRLSGAVIFKDFILFVKQSFVNNK